MKLKWKRKSKAQQSPSAMDQKDTTCSPQQQLTANATGSWTLYSTCSKTPLDRFIDVYERREYERLIITGNPPRSALLEAWEKLFQEFNDLRKDDTYAVNTDKIVEINKLRLKVEFATKCVQLFEQGIYSEEYNKMLKKIGVRVTLNPDDEVQFYEGVQRIVTQIRKWMNDIEELHIELTRIQENMPKVDNDQSFFDEMLIILSKENGFWIKSHEITVAQFVKMENRLKEANEKKLLKNGN